MSYEYSISDKYREVKCCAKKSAWPSARRSLVYCAIIDELSGLILFLQHAHGCCSSRLPMPFDSAALVLLSRLPVLQIDLPADNTSRSPACQLLADTNSRCHSFS